MSQFTKGHAQDLLKLVIFNQNCIKKETDFGKKSSTIIFISFRAKKNQNKKFPCPKPDIRLELKNITN